MNQPSACPILVTGAHRTGTTWVGRMLAAGLKTAYISEPLNAFHYPGILQVYVKYWYLYVCPENEAEYLDSFVDLLKFKYHVWAGIRSLHSGRDFLRIGRDLGICLRAQAFHQRPILKDPFAVFSLPWFADRLNSKIVVTIRHPAGFASSLQRLNWSFDFVNLLDQPLLMRDHLEPYRSDMQATVPDDIIGQAALLWKMVYQTVQSDCERIPLIQVVRHEDLSLDPLTGFRELYANLGLEFNSQVEQTILDSSKSENPKEVSRTKVHATKLDSRANLDNWKRRLSSEEIARIRRMTEEVAHQHYPEESWN